MNDIIKLMSNPVRIRIIQFLLQQGEATTKQIAEKLPDIPAPTIYRHINLLLKDEALTITSEHKVRGSLERTLALNVSKIINAKNGSLADMAYSFFMSLYSQFYQYAQQENSDPVKDCLFLSTVALHLTDQDYETMMTEIGAIIQKYQAYENKQEGKVRSFSLISAPAVTDNT